MWANVEAQLIDLLGDRLYPKLLTDPGYRIVLRNAGLVKLPKAGDGKSREDFLAAQRAWGMSKPMTDKPKLPETDKLTPHQQARLRSAAALCARLMLLDVRDLDCLVEKGAKAKLLTGRGSIYRVWDATAQNQTRHWWFSEALKLRAIKESKLRNITPGDWIRDALAISLDFGKCDRISRISLNELEGVPAIVALGLKKPQWSTVHRDAKGKTRGGVTPDVDPMDYWVRMGQFFEGNKTQYFLPFLPPDLIKEDAWV
jgi:hypothetical protein